MTRIRPKATDWYLSLLVRKLSQTRFLSMLGLMPPLLSWATT